ncbi:sugar ABC transporter ATP-binding protein [Paenibacillus sp. sgz302251]|uniref:sugar ABC transporter ATP-binding protein n=1 Tax=Paenibacillus sp. sgz302251 TaxID=3414493 RepID=UPI003C7A68A8
MSFLEVRQVVKRYGATLALDHVSFEVEKGAFHAIIGENGAGKSTFIKILSGLVSLNEGEIVLNGQQYQPKNIMDARSTGISTAFQELSLLPNLTVAENLVLPDLNKGSGLISKRRNNDYAAELLDEFGLSHIAPTREVRTLSLAERQKLEITRAISHKPKLLLLDEPTAALPDADWLFRILERIGNGDLTILYISHRLNEIREYCKTGTVLRNGKSIDTIRLDSVTDSDIFQMMIGDSKDKASDSKTKTRAANRDPGIEVKQLTGKTVRNISFNLHKGEILGVAGLEGQGQHELFQLLAGLMPMKEGSIKIEQREVKIKSPKSALRNGMFFIPEERKTEGIFQGLSTLSNISISSLNKINRLGFIGSKRELGNSKVLADKMTLEERYLQMPIESLSGGNQQKALMSRALMTESQYLLLYDPSRGVDIPTKNAFYHMAQEFTAEGGSVLWYSTDLPELIDLCDRILVFYKGQIVADVMREAFDSENLLSAATGHFTAKEVRA